MSEVQDLTQRQIELLRIVDAEPDYRRAVSRCHEWLEGHGYQCSMVHAETLMVKAKTARLKIKVLG